MVSPSSSRPLSPRLSPLSFSFSFALLLLLLSAVGSVQAKSGKNSGGDLLFLTFANGSDARLQVNLVHKNGKQKQLTLASGSQKAELGKQFTVREQAVADPFSTSRRRNSFTVLPLLTAETGNLSQDGSISYSINGLNQGRPIRTRPLFNKDQSASDDYRLKVCVFGDFTQNLYEHAELNVSRIIDAEGCQLNLFIGKIAWERHQKPQLGFSFSPYVMLHSQRSPSRHQALAQVPSIFGGIGGNLDETTFFQFTEVGDVAFIQLTVEIATVADLPDGTVEYDMMAKYFREYMLTELECKLQELHGRKQRPWIILYMTHPYLVTNDESQVQWFVFNNTDRFFDVLKRYKVDLLTSCGIEGMARMLDARRKQMPDVKLPEYIQTTMAQCGGYLSADTSLQNECTYALLDIGANRMSFQKKAAEGKGTGAGAANGALDNKVMAKGEIERTFEKADQCVPEQQEL